jgi:superfamily II DNA or RNA helicase
MPTVTLRPWQRAAYERFLASPDADFLAVATPGAGKTTFALTCARATLADRPSPLVVVAPTSHLKVQWAQAAHRLGLQLDPDWAPGDGLARDVHGLVTTYQQIATGDSARRLAGLGADGFVILDEIHHAGHDRAWGDAVGTAFGHAARRLALSGTPFRSDAAPIPFVRYHETGEGGLAQADFTYGYADALRDGGVVRPVHFPRVDGEMEWTTAAGDVVSASFAEELTADHVSMRLRTALSLEGEWMPAVLASAHAQLRQLRDVQRDAGGLVVATDRDHARGIARLLRDRFGTPADVVVSDDPAASRRIAEFAQNDRPWLVAVRMVSEGVDIPRLRVGVYATTTTTELFFRQAVGRFVRWQPGEHGQRDQRDHRAYVYVPDDPRLRAHAFAIAQERRHVLRPSAPASDDDRPDGVVDRERPEPEQLSLFSVVSATATDITVHAVEGHGLHEPTAEPSTTPPAHAAAASDLDLDLPEVPTPAGLAPAHTMSVAERKDDLRTRNAHVAKRLVDVTGWSHGKVQGEMNRLAGITRVASATTDQLERRLRYAESWLRRLQR